MRVLRCPMYLRGKFYAVILIFDIRCHILVCSAFHCNYNCCSDSEPYYIVGKSLVLEAETTPGTAQVLGVVH